jgi:hypothetical protein
MSKKKRLEILPEPAPLPCEKEQARIEELQRIVASRDRELLWHYRAAADTDRQLRQRILAHWDEVEFRRLTPAIVGRMRWGRMLELLAEIEGI